ncbi:MAG: hypothetical protein A2X19_10520 [Bacteroidetes bacterium GWE2_39_28]|nr:MAG: hypothetical protein A2X19_10520 [Bacteroidetes bacterium GWE2_39_28]OFY13637.1 MAG: hypothetical protein A2X16_07860 [Bacteroidetes bacterium GWF2_39_10]OFZ07347.1 MAG: hypothetical protein A2322_01225 [Bacteroidetes bacterium RIFOXYB2_FULL_39_7]OFZ11776.1 MAG: hypothetical protein A2465_05865 [Bacteroidetes bacterium RIFOXYC2_FULL_39_11]
MSRYLESLAPGIFMDMTLILVILVVILQIFKNDSPLNFKNSLHLLSLLSFIWLLYCVLQAFNPSSSGIIAWATSVRGVGMYFFIIVLLTSLFVSKYKHVRKILILWALLSIFAVLKAFFQKTFGFDFAEQRWLDAGGRTTHIIYSGIRYFSIFTDAANFGTGIAFSMLVFGISAIYIKEFKLRIFLVVTAAICAYGMIISGTRGSLAVPFIGLVVFAFLSKNYKIIIITTLFVAGGYWFLSETSYGQGNQYIRRMRSAFNPDDPSLLVRLENQRILKIYMRDKPLGAGLGMSRGSATTYMPDPVLAIIPSDSWYVLIWVETGIVGLLLHLLILMYILLHGSFLVMFRLKTPEIKGIVTAILCGISGIYIAAYSIEILGQFPFAFITFICMTIVFISPGIEKELINEQYPA